MTILLIVVIIAIIITINQKGKLSNEKAKYEENTVTNVTLEKDVKAEWVKKVDEEIDKINPPTGELFNTLIGLFSYYDVPIQGCSISMNYSEEEKKLELAKLRVMQSEWLSVSEYYNDDLNPITYYEMEKKLPLIIDSKGVERSPLKLAKIISVYYNILEIKSDTQAKQWQIDSANKYASSMTQLEPEEIVSRISEFKMLYFKHPIPCDKTPSQLLHYYMDKRDMQGSYVLREQYDHLITLLTRRSMKGKGYNLSPDGVHESKWQEQKKNNETYRELKEKYPWNYPKD